MAFIQSYKHRSTADKVDSKTNNYGLYFSRMSKFSTVLRVTFCVPSPIILTFYHSIPTFIELKKKPCENIVEKGETTGNQHILLFPQCFPPFRKQISSS